MNLFWWKYNTDEALGEAHDCGESLRIQNKCNL